MALHWKNTEAEYGKRLELFQQKSDHFVNLHKALREHLATALDKIGLHHEQINILSIGSGNGKTDIEIVKITNDEVQRRSEGNIAPIKLFNRAVEPNKTFLDLYKTAVESLSQDLINAVFDIDRPRTFEEYIVETKDPVQFDIVHFIHCLYYIDVETALKHCYEKELGEKGIIVCVVGHPDNLMSSLKREEETLNSPPFDLINTKLSSILKKSSWKHDEYTAENYYDVSHVFDENSEEGNMILDFFMFKVDFRLNTSPNIVDKYLEMIKKHCLYKDGKYLAKHAQRIVVIYKN